ncbi:hypothetical protein ACI6Q2_22490 [Chitinophagaceae bacterium LWZ2-11]
MKFLFRKKILSLVLTSVILYSCNMQEQSVAKRLYEQKTYLLSEFQNKSILVSRKGNLIVLSYHKDGNLNQFFFDKGKEDYILVRDTLQYPINEISAFSSINKVDSLHYKYAIVAELKRMLKKMDTLNIKGVSAEFASLGIVMKIYLEQNGALLYVPNPDVIKDERWKSYVNTAKKYDDNWYYTKDE